MAGATLSTLSGILKEYYMGPTRKEWRHKKEWTCPDHSFYFRGRFVDQCAYDPDCHDYDCPHTENIRVEPACEKCETAKWRYFFDDDGEPTMEEHTIYGIQDALASPSILLGMLSSRPAL